MGAALGHDIAMHITTEAELKASEGHNYALVQALSVNETQKMELLLSSDPVATRGSVKLLAWFSNCPYSLSLHSGKVKTWAKKLLAVVCDA